MSFFNQIISVIKSFQRIQLFYFQIVSLGFRVAVQHLFQTTAHHRQRCVAVYHLLQTPRVVFCSIKAPLLFNGTPPQVVLCNSVAPLQIITYHTSVSVVYLSSTSFSQLNHHRQCYVKVQHLFKTFICQKLRFVAVQRLSQKFAHPKGALCSTSSLQLQCRNVGFLEYRFVTLFC